MLRTYSDLHRSNIGKFSNISTINADCHQTELINPSFHAPSSLSLLLLCYDYCYYVIIIINIIRINFNFVASPNAKIDFRESFLNVKVDRASDVFPYLNV